MKLDEKTYDDDAHLLAFKRPDGKFVFMVSNRSGTRFTFNINTGVKSATFAGLRCTPEDAGSDFKRQPTGTRAGDQIQITVLNLTWKFWIQQ